MDGMYIETKIDAGSRRGAAVWVGCVVPLYEYYYGGP